MSILIEQLINITDAVFLGHVGEIELGASAVAWTWYLAVYMLGFGFSQGLQVVVAQRNGEQRYAETGRIFFQGLFFLSGFAVALCLFSNWFSPVVLSKLIMSGEVYHALMDYMDWRIWGLLFSFPFLALRSFLVGITRTKALGVAALAAVLVNILANWLLIFHLDMGIAGAAIASSFAEFCSLAVLSAYVLRKMDKRHYGLHCRYDKRVLCNVCRMSVWSMLQSFVGVAPWFMFFVSIEHLGEMQLAMANIVRSVSTLFFCHCQFVCGYDKFFGWQSDWRKRKGQGAFDMRPGYSFRLYDRFPSDSCRLIIPSTHCRCLYGQYGYYTCVMAPVCCDADELCFCIARLCLYECCYRNGSYADGFHVSGDNNCRLHSIFIGFELLQCTPCRLLDGRISVCDRSWSTVLYSSQI